MKAKLAPIVAIVLAWALTAFAAEPGTLTSLKSISAVDNQAADLGLPVLFEATVTENNSLRYVLFVQDGDVGIYVFSTSSANLFPGDRVLVRGRTHASFRPYIVSSSITVLRHGTLPKAVPASFDELVRAKYDCRRVTVRAVVKAAHQLSISDAKHTYLIRHTYLQLLADGGNIDADLDSDDPGALNGLLDSEVEVTGVAAGIFDGKMQLTGIKIHARSLEDVKVLKRGWLQTKSLPFTPMDEVFTQYHVNNRTRRVRVQGTITYYEPGSAVVLQDGSKSIWIETQASKPLRIGDVTEATGFPDVHNGFLLLTEGDVEDRKAQAPVSPLLITGKQLSFWNDNTRGGHQYDLVSVEGQLVMMVREEVQDEYVLVADGHPFSAFVRHPDSVDGPIAAAPIKEIPIGSKVRVSGICIIENSNPSQAQVPYHLLLRSADDIVVVAKPSWLTTRNLFLIISALMVAMFAVGFWVWALRRKVDRQTAALEARAKAEAVLQQQMVQLEQQRNRMLEDANVSLQSEIHERRQAESEAQKARDSAEAANRAKSEFLANMSHEIRTPLNGVVGMTDLALDTQLTSEQKEYMETVKQSADSLLTVINDILDFSKIEAGKIDLEMINFNLRDCLEMTLKTLALRSDQKGLELLCEIASEVPEYVVGDPTRLRQIIINLVGNAIKFTDQGEIALTASVETNEEGKRVIHFVVSDTGIGIAQEKLKQIFDPFSQADNSTTRKFGGTGLGLTISSRLVGFMGGRIWVESELGKGTQFHFTAMLAEVADEAQPEAKTLPQIPCGARILVVDDNRTNRRILEVILKHWGADVRSVDSGQSALNEMLSAQRAGQPYRLMLTDMHMPSMDGFTLIERVRATPEISAAAIMMLTSADYRNDTERCRQLGVAAYLLKPIRQSELREAIRRVTETSEQKEMVPVIERNSLQVSNAPVLRILVAEDNAVNQRVISRFLEKRGHQVELAADGQRALSALERENFDLILMDVQMPEMDGMEATARIRAGEADSGRHQIIIALTAHAMKGDEERFRAAGMDDYLMKPLNPQRLDSLLAKYIAQGHEVRNRVEPLGATVNSESAL